MFWWTTNIRAIILINNDQIITVAKSVFLCSFLRVFFYHLKGDTFCSQKKCCQQTAISKMGSSKTLKKKTFKIFFSVGLLLILFLSLSIGCDALFTLVPRYTAKQISQQKKTTYMRTAAEKKNQKYNAISIDFRLFVWTYNQTQRKRDTIQTRFYILRPLVFVCKPAWKQL